MGEYAINIIIPDKVQVERKTFDEPEQEKPLFIGISDFGFVHFADPETELIYFTLFPDEIEMIANESKLLRERNDKPEML